MDLDTNCQKFLPKVVLKESHPIALAGSIKIEAPLGGWRSSQGEQIQYTQRVLYPTSFVSTQEDQSPTAVIKGRIARSVIAVRPAVQADR
jgi:uncharacterized protein YfaP (DUF2135 family)